MIIKKIFDGIFDESVHVAFLKFGRGKYYDKYLIEGKKQAKNWAIKTGADYVNFLVRRCLEKVNGSVAVKGVIVSTLDMKDEIKFDIVKVGNFQGIKKIKIDTEVDASVLLELMNKFPRVFFALSFKSDDFVLKVKAKAPKSGKPGKGGGNLIADFCSLKTKDENLVKELFFNVGDFNQIKINHLIKVNEIVYPENIEELKPAEIRELSKRKGVVVRNINVDGKMRSESAEFVA